MSVALKRNTEIAKEAASSTRKLVKTGQQGNVIHIGPQPGPQTMFTASTADIVIYGGAAGGGKSFGLLMNPLRHMRKSPDFGAVIFRKTSVQVKVEGGLWDESNKMYPLFGGKSHGQEMSWSFPHPTEPKRRGMSVSFAHLEHEKDIYNYQGAQIPFIGFDELTHFSENQFFYMLSRNRSTSGVKPRIRATCNPDPDSWVKTFILWWLDANGEYADPAKSGKVRWFIRLGDKIHWANTKEEIFAQYGETDEIIPKSVTFIAAKLEDNKILMSKDPAYLGNLLAMNRVDRERLRNGNWKVRPAAGMLFQRTWFQVLDFVPSGFIASCRFWDRAATKPSEVNKDPDWTRGLKLFKYPNGTFLIADLKSMRDTPGQVEDFILKVASQDGLSCRVKAQQDPGSSGVMEVEYFMRKMAGYDVRTQTMSKDKLTRAKPVSSQAEWGNVFVLRAPWNDEFFTECENFSDDPREYAHDDIVDALSGAFNELSGGFSTADVTSALANAAGRR